MSEISRTNRSSTGSMRRVLMQSSPVIITTIDDSRPIQIAQIRINDTPEVMDEVPLMQFYGFSAVLRPAAPPMRPRFSSPASAATR